MIELFETRGDITYLLYSDEYIDYWYLKVRKNNKNYWVITNACTAYKAYSNMRKEFGEDADINMFGGLHIPIKGYAIETIPKTEKKGIKVTKQLVPKILKTGEVALIYMYKRTREGVVKISEFEHPYYKGETDVIVEHKYRRLYPNYYIKIVSKREEKHMDSKKKIELVKKLKEETSTGMQDCNNAILEAYEELKIDESKTYDDIYVLAKNKLADKKLIVAYKKQGNELKHFIIKSSVKEDRIIMIKFGCESEQTKKLLLSNHEDILVKISDIALASDVIYGKDLLSLDFDDDNTVGMKLNDLSGKFSERVDIVSFEYINMNQPGNQTEFMYYNHANKIGCIIEYKVKEKDETTLNIVRKLLHHIVYTNPIFKEDHEVLQSVVDYEMNTITKEIESSPKIPKEKIKDIITAKVNKFLDEVVLSRQKFEFDEKKQKRTVKKVLEDSGISLLEYAVV